MAKNSAVPPVARVTTAARHPKGTLAATILGSSLAFIDGSVVNVALPAVERDLVSSGASGASIGWLINAYLLTLGAPCWSVTSRRSEEIAEPMPERVL